MKLGLHNYAIIIPTENSGTKFNNKTVYKGIILHKITELYKKRFSACPNIRNHKISNHRHIQKIRKKDSNKTCRYVHNFSPYEASSV
jgi:N-acetyl-anhydromuramyl-L-alanine amidase AmpD